MVANAGTHLAVKDPMDTMCNQLIAVDKTLDLDQMRNEDKLVTTSSFYKKPNMPLN